MTTPIVSVVMSVFNGERFLREAVESILAQSFRDFEFIVIDDGSTDRTGEILNRYQRSDPPVRVYYQENRGLIDSLNRGCELARGKYIARMDADDIAVRNRLMWQVDFMEKHPEVGVVGGTIECINSTGKSVRTYRHPIRDREIKSALLRGGVGFCHPTVLMRREVLVSVGGYRKVVVHAEDYDLWLRIADRFQLANLGAVVLKYRLHPYQICVRACREMALTRRAAQIAAWSRRNGNPDPLDLVEEITPTVLAGLGVSEATQRADLAGGHLMYIRNMSDAGEYSVPLNVMIQMMSASDFKSAKKGEVADFLLWAARGYWRQRKFAKSILTFGHALITWPIMVGRPLKPLLRSLRLLPMP